MSDDRFEEARRLILMLTLALSDVCDHAGIDTDKIGVHDGNLNVTVNLGDLMEQALTFHRDGAHQGSGRPN